MRNKVVYSLASHSLLVMGLDTKQLLYSYLWTVVFQTMCIRKTFKWEKFTLILNGAQKCKNVSSLVGFSMLEKGIRDRPLHANHTAASTRHI